jgi:hypothetical protein
MRARTVQFLHSARECLPYLWGFAAAAALDHVIDIQTLFLPVIAATALVCAACVGLRSKER